MTKLAILSVAAIPSLALLSACGEEREPADTSFEQRMPPPVPIEDGPGPVPDNPVGSTRDEVRVDYSDDGDSNPDAATVREDRSTGEETPPINDSKEGPDLDGGN